MQQYLEHVFHYMLWLTPVLVVIGVTAVVLRRMIFGGRRAAASPNPAEQVSRAKHARQLRQADRAAYLDQLEQRQIEPEGYITDEPGVTSEPGWLKPVYSTDHTYEQPPNSWINKQM